MIQLKLILIIACFLLVRASKESFDNLDELLDDPNIWQYIEKRVGHEDKNQNENREESNGKSESNTTHEKQQKSEDRYRDDQLVGKSQHQYPYFGRQKNHGRVNLTPPKTISDSSGNACTFQQNSSVIIRSKSSLENGAAFLKNAFHLSAEECARKCCYTQNCNLAVYEDKEEHSCYLFDCGTPSKCLFAPHANYTVLSFQENSIGIGAQQKYHENELENLGKTPKPQPPKTTTLPPVIVKVPLYGDCDIDWGQTCADQNAECRNEQCKCKGGYHAIYAYCRKICKNDEFQCENKGQDDTVPDCIDRNHRCDGVPQCADGSDEEDCPSKIQGFWNSKYHKNKEHKDDDRMKTNGEYKTKPHDVDRKKPADIDKIKEDDIQTNDDNTPSPPSPIVAQEDKSGDTRPDVPQHKDNKEKEEADKSEDIKESDRGSQELDNNDTKLPVSTKPTTPKVLKLQGPNKVLIKSPTDSSQGPIVALALGLGICLMLLIFVGCRLRTVKRRIRRGKSLHSNEADYLINGMYL